MNVLSGMWHAIVTMVVNALQEGGQAEMAQQLLAADVDPSALGYDECVVKESDVTLLEQAAQAAPLEDLEREYVLDCIEGIKGA